MDEREERWVECDGCHESYGPDRRTVDSYLMDLPYRGEVITVCRGKPSCLELAQEDMDGQLERARAARVADGRDTLNAIHEAMDDEAPDGDSGDYDI